MTSIIIENNANQHHALQNQRKLVILLLFLWTVLSVGSVVLLHENYTIIRQSTPQIEASLRMRLAIADGHLFLEEIIGGDPAESIDDVMASFESAHRLSHVIIGGGTDKDGQLPPLTNQDAITIAEKIPEMITTLLEQTKSRLEHPERSQIASPADIEFDSTYDALINQCDLLEKKLQSIILIENRNFASIQKAIIGFNIVSAIVFGIVIMRYIAIHSKDQKLLVEANQGLNANNQQVRAANQQLQANEQQLRAINDQLRESEATLHSILAAAPVGIGMVKDRIIGFTNTQLSNMLGYSNDELMGMKARDFYESDEEYERVGSEKHADVEKFGIGSIETRWKRKNGATFDLMLSSATIVEKDLSAGMIFTAMDISDLKKLDDERERFVAILEATSDMVSMADADGHILYLNSAGRKMMHFPDNLDVSQLKISDFHPSWAIDKVLNEGLPASSKTGLWQGETAVKSTKGQEIPVSQVILSHHNETGNIKFHSTIIRNISEEKQNQAEREKLINQLESQNAELERFTYTVSHDLKSPIITIKGFLGMLAEDLAKGDQALIDKDIMRINNAAEKMHTLLEELLTLSRVGRISNPAEQINLNDLFETVIELLSGIIDQHEAIVTIQSDMGTILADRPRMGEVFQNLIENAIKYQAPDRKPVIDISSKQTKDSITLSIKDNGIGIDPEYQDKVFGLFEKLDPETEGTGVGLALAKRIIEVHKGSIWMESNNPDDGSTFYITLPLTTN